MCGWMDDKIESCCKRSFIPFHTVTNGIRDFVLLVSRTAYSTDWLKWSALIALSLIACPTQIYVFSGWQNIRKMRVGEKENKTGEWTLLYKRLSNLTLMYLEWKCCRFFANWYICVSLRTVFMFLGSIYNTDQACSSIYVAKNILR